MNWTSPTTAVSTSWDRPIRRGPSDVLTGPCSGVRRIVQALVKGLALGNPLAEASTLVAGMTRTTGLVSPCAMRAVGIEPCLLRLAVNSARPSLVAVVRAALIIDQNPSAGPNGER